MVGNASAVPETTNVAIVKPKQLLASTTAIGGIIAAAATIVPILAKAIFGIDVSAADVQSLGDAVMVAIQGLAAVVGLVMVFIGRIKAGKVAQPVALMPASAPPVAVVVNDATLVKNVGGK